MNKYFIDYFNIAEIDGNGNEIKKQHYRLGYTDNGYNPIGWKRITRKEAETLARAASKEKKEHKHFVWSSTEIDNLCFAPYFRMEFEKRHLSYKSGKVIMYNNKSIDYIYGRNFVELKPEKIGTM